MSVQNTQEKDSANVNRRKIVRGALGAAPIIATLTSKPVHAVQGLSNMLSGDASVCRGDNRYGGMSPGFWKKPNGMSSFPYVTTGLAAWQLTGYDYGTLIDGKDGNKYTHYSGGTKYSDVFGSNILDSGRSLREVLNQDNGTRQFHLIAGLLNALFFEANAVNGGTQYIFSSRQFWNMYDGNLSVPDAYRSLKDLIKSNYHQTPGSDCTISSND